MGTVATTIRFKSDIREALSKACVPPYNQTYIIDQALRAYSPVKKHLAATDTPIQQVLAPKQESIIPSPVQPIFEHWRNVMERGAGTKLTPKRLKNIKDRLTDGYTVDEIKQAIDGCKTSSFHMGDNDGNTMHNDIELICRSGEKLEGFIGRSQVSPAAVKEGLRQAKSESRSQARVRVRSPLSAAAQQDDFIEGSCSRE